MNYLEKVKQFNDTTGCFQPEKPNLEGRTKLRIDLIQEELDELKDGIKIKSKLDTLDALCDLQYVLSGAIIELGFIDIFNEAFNRVHESNMSKFCKTNEEAWETLDSYKLKDIESYWTKVDSLYIVKRMTDGKTLKSINYKPVNLINLLT